MSNRQQQFGLGAGQTVGTGGQGSILSKRGVATVDPRTNILFVTDTASRLEEVRRIIRQIDTPIRQVLIEARIVVAGDRFSRQLGVRFGQQTGFTLGKRFAVGSTGSLSTQPVVKTEGDRLTRETRTPTPFEIASQTVAPLGYPGYSDSPALNINLPVTNPAGQLALTLINLGSGNLINLELSALEAEARGKVVSSPRVVTADNQKAHIEQGTEIPYVTPGSANSPATVSFKKAVLRLDVTPQITPDNRIIMTVEIRKDSVGQFVQLGGGFQVPSIDTKNVTTQISVNNGDTAVIGGIYEETIRNDVDKVPVPRRPPVPGLPVQDDGQVEREDRAADLPDAARRQGHRDLGAVADARGRLVRVCRLTYNAPVQLHRGNLFLVGLPGAGKSTLGRQLARRLGRRFVDADHELERRLGVSIPTIFEIEGEAVFRDREEAVIADLTMEKDIVLATGGGAVLRPANRERLRANGTVVYLHAEPETLHARVGRSKHRPLLNVSDPFARLRELYSARDALYREVADCVVESDRDAVARFIAQLEAAQRAVASP